jgi:hypothetical protein
MASPGGGIAALMEARSAKRQRLDSARGSDVSPSDLAENLEAAADRNGHQGDFAASSLMDVAEQQEDQDPDGACDEDGSGNENEWGLPTDEALLSDPSDPGHNLATKPSADDLVDLSDEVDDGVCDRGSGANDDGANLVALMRKRSSGVLSGVATPVKSGDRGMAHAQLANLNSRVPTLTFLGGGASCARHPLMGVPTAADLGKIVRLICQICKHQSGDPTNGLEVRGASLKRASSCHLV